MQAYSDPSRQNDPYALPDVEIFYMTEEEIESFGHDSIWFDSDDGFCYKDEGWYYWYCFPGCLPDSDPIGPFDTEQEAIESAQEDSDI